jgi:hypothetical protein
MSAAIDVLNDLAVIGATIRPEGDQLILRAGATPVPAGLVGRIRRAKAELLTALAQADLKKKSGSLGADLVAPPDWFGRFVPLAWDEPSFNEPCAARRGRVGEEGGVLLHFCVECGRWGAFGYGVSLRADRKGRWYCAAHRPL